MLVFDKIWVLALIPPLILLILLARRFARRRRRLPVPSLVP